VGIGREILYIYIYAMLSGLAKCVPILVGFGAFSVYGSAVAPFDEPDDVHTLVYGALLVGIFGLAPSGFAVVVAAPITIPFPCGGGAIGGGWLWASSQGCAWTCGADARGPPSFGISC
jgi:hypothetical protein